MATARPGSDGAPWTAAGSSRSTSRSCARTRSPASRAAGRASTSARPPGRCASRSTASRGDTDLRHDAPRRAGAGRLRLRRRGPRLLDRGAAAHRRAGERRGELHCRGRRLLARGGRRALAGRRRGAARDRSADALPGVRRFPRRARHDQALLRGRPARGPTSRWTACSGGGGRPGHGAGPARHTASRRPTCWRRRPAGGTCCRGSPRPGDGLGPRGREWLDAVRAASRVWASGGQGSRGAGKSGCGSGRGDDRGCGGSGGAGRALSQRLGPFGELGTLGGVRRPRGRHRRGAPRGCRPARSRPGRSRPDAPARGGDRRGPCVVTRDRNRPACRPPAWPWGPAAPCARRSRPCSVHRPGRASAARASRRG